MKCIQYKVKDPLGIHARPAGLLVKAVSAFKSTALLKCGEKEVDAKRIMAVMSLGVKGGSLITMTFKGEDEDKASAAVQKFLTETI